MGCHNKSNSEVVEAVARKGRRSATSILSVINRIKALL